MPGSGVVESKEPVLVYPVDGVRLSAIASHIRYEDRLDLVLIELAKDSVVSGVFTQNAFCAAPVTIAKKHLQAKHTRCFLINTGNANAGTGAQGLQDAQSCCSQLASHLKLDHSQVLPFSTGVIGEALPVEKITDVIPQLCSELSVNNWFEAATGIMTTDTRPKVSSRQLRIQNKTITISGIAKGSGMIKPDMATMLAFICTDLAIQQKDLDSLLNEATLYSFNRITVDGDTSTNDCCMLSATGASMLAIENLTEEERAKFNSELHAVFQELATGLIRDAEGASKFVTVNVDGGASSEECLQVAYTVAESPLVKTALFASDPNWGRILAAIGRAGLENLDISQVAIFLGEQLIAVNGAVAPKYTENLAQAEMEKDEFSITIKLGRGEYSETIWTSDLSHDYVRINAEYRT